MPSETDPTHQSSASTWTAASLTPTHAQVQLGFLICLASSQLSFNLPREHAARGGRSAAIVVPLICSRATTSTTVRITGAHPVAAERAAAIITVGSVSTSE